MKRMNNCREGKRSKKIFPISLSFYAVSKDEDIIDLEMIEITNCEVIEFELLSTIDSQYFSRTQ